MERPADRDPGVTSRGDRFEDSVDGRTASAARTPSRTVERPLTRTRYGRESVAEHAWAAEHESVAEHGRAAEHEWAAGHASVTEHELAAEHEWADQHGCAAEILPASPSLSL